ncbi:ribonuclease H-like protein [Virus Rctr71]|nr:ribonuclease H-like protein [Virus Rctr71]
MTEEPMSHATIYTDGSCKKNPGGPGAWAALIVADGTKIQLSGGFRNTTSNRMEMRAAIEALKSLHGSWKVDLYTDSTYLKDGITSWVYRWQRNGWRTYTGKPVKNEDLWRELLKHIGRHQMTWHWVKGHAKNEHNNLVDELAGRVASNVGRRDPEDTIT